MDAWVDCTDTDIIESVSGSQVVEIGVCEAVAAASEILTVLSGYRAHPGGIGTQEYNAAAWVNRLTPAYRPVTDIVLVEAVAEDCATATDVTDQWCLYAGDIRRARTATNTMNPVFCNFCSQAHSRLRVQYVFGSTIGAVGRRAVLALSRQLWLSDHPEAGECILPERVVSMSREGLSYSFIDPMNFLDQGRTGIPTVDTFLMFVNPTKSKVPSAVYIPEAPPGVMR